MEIEEAINKSRPKQQFITLKQNNNNIIPRVPDSLLV